MRGRAVAVLLPLTSVRLRLQTRAAGLGGLGIRPSFRAARLVPGINPAATEETALLARADEVFE